MTKENLTSIVDHVTLTSRRKLRVGRIGYRQYIILNQDEIPVTINNDIVLYKGMIKYLPELPTVKALQKGAKITVTSYNKIVKGCK